MDYAVEISKLTKYYQKNLKSPKKLALENLDLLIPKGSIFALLGPNGAGKSTLINILAGTVIKSSGFVAIMGNNIDQSPKVAKSNIGIVPQEIAINSFFTIFQLLEFAAGYYGIRTNQRKTTEILKSLSLWEKKDSYPRQLSGGMKRRFLIAKAMVHSPPVLVLDEPTAGVDIELREHLWELIKKLNSQGVTIIITTHYLAEAEELCDRIAFINHGKIIKEDTKENLLSDLGSKHINIEFAQEIANSLQNFDEKYEILSANKIQIEFNSFEKSINEILAKVQQTELIINNVNMNVVDLEDIFKKLMKDSQ